MSGGWSSGGSSSNSGDGGFVVLVFVVLIVIVFLVVRSKLSGPHPLNDWSTNGNDFRQGTPASVSAPVRAKLETLRRTDPGFSLVVFEDFLYFLYASVHRARGVSKLDELAAYVADGARSALRGDPRLTEVTGIIIGSISYESVDVDAQGGAQISVIVESNYVERYRDPDAEQRYYAQELLILTRAAGARSRDPGKARTLNCPNCGAPLSNMRGTSCAFCKTTIREGSKDWAIIDVKCLEREPRGPLLTSDVAEVGTNLPTIAAPNALPVFAQIVAKDPQNTSWESLQRRIGLVFQAFHAGWVTRDPARVRPFVSDNLFQSQVYWIDLYLRAKCINRTDGACITKMELASATSDAYYDAVTVRVFATGLDFTISEDGRLLSGSQSRPRSYSEYWTMIRGAQHKVTDKTEQQCPNCGAPLKISMTGNCEYCAVKVTSGEYDWVLSRIEQDEAYTG
jgi:hypothetical protein